jgi:hypothetical protein
VLIVSGVKLAKCIYYLKRLKNPSHQFIICD